MKRIPETFLVVTMLFVASDANAVGRRDAAALAALRERALDLDQALTEAQSAAAKTDAAAADCLSSVRDAANQTADQLTDVSDVAPLAASLPRGAAHRLGSQATAKAAIRALAVLPAEQRQTSDTAGLCASETLVRTQAAALQALIDETTPLLERLARP
jgi:hypothetical protein